jgi:hypothetical protein
VASRWVKGRQALPQMEPKILLDVRAILRFEARSVHDLASFTANQILSEIVTFRVETIV